MLAQIHEFFKKNIFLLRVLLMHALGRGGARGVHGLMGFFDPIHYSGSKKNSTQPNPTHMVGLGWVELMD